MASKNLPVNLYCQTLGIAVPRLESVVGHREAGPFSLLLVTLLENGVPMSLEQVARRFEEAGVAPFEQALKSIKRSRPGRAPVYRQGDLYSLDPHDDDLDLWAFRLGLRPAKAHQHDPQEEAREEPEETAQVEPKLLPGSDVPASLDELKEAFEGASLNTWSRQRLAALLLEAHGEPMDRREGSAMLSRWTPYHPLRPDYPNRWTYGTVKEDAEGNWTLDSSHSQLLGARKALRGALAKARERKSQGQPTHQNYAAMSSRWEQRQQQERQALEALKRCLIIGFPRQAPQWIVLLDLASRKMSFFPAQDFGAARAALDSYDWFGALDVRLLLAALDFDPGARHLADLGPPQKTLVFHQRGRPLRLTPELMAKGCTNRVKPFGDEKKMLRFLEQGKISILHRHMTLAMETLFGLYQYCKLHGAVRIVRGQVEMMLPVPWVRHAEQVLPSLKQQAFEHQLELEAVFCGLPSLKDPWASSIRLVPIQTGKYSYSLVTKYGDWIGDRAILNARLALPGEETGGPVH